MNGLPNVLAPGLGLWRLGRRRVGGALVLLCAAALAGIVVLAVAGGRGWPILIPAAALGAAFALSHILLRNELAVRQEPAWRLHVASHRETIEAHLEHGRTLEALTEIGGWLQEDPHSAEAWVFRARLDAVSGLLDRARQSYQRAARWDDQGRFSEEIRHALEVLEGPRR